jgi:antitoxin component YwqK of YwqJK toxin-antitoxin module
LRKQKCRSQEVKYIDGKEDGNYNIWHPNGKSYIKGDYKMGDRVGVWTFYDTLGKVTRKTDFGKK